MYTNHMHRYMYARSYVTYLRNSSWTCPLHKPCGRCYSFSVSCFHTHTSLWIHMVCYQFTLEVNETKIYARGCGTETIPIIQVMHATWDFLTVKTPLLAKMIIYLAAEPCWSCFEFNILHNGAPCKKIVFNFSCLLDKVKRLNTSTWITVRERF